MARKEFNDVDIRVEFNEAANRQQISSGDNVNTLFGKIRKWLSDLKPVAFSGKYSDLTEKATAQDVGALPVSGGTLESNVEPQLSLKRRSQNFSSLLNFENESRKLIQTKGGLENNDPTREAYFSLYDLDADKNGEDKIIELFHLSQNLRNIYDSVTKSMKKILVEGEALPTKDGIVEKYVTIRTGAFPQLRLGRMDYGESVGIEMFHGNVGTDGRGIVLEAWRESEESQDINLGIRNRVSGKSLVMIKSSNSEINSTNRHPLILRSLNEDKTNSVDIRFRVGSVWTNQLCSAIDGEMFFWDSVHEHSLFAVSESKRQIYDYKTNNLQEIVTKNDLKFQPGETYKMAGDIPLPGYLTTASTTVFFIIALPKSAQGRTASVSGNFRIRQDGGYLVNDGAFSDYNSNCYILENLLRIAIMKKDGSAFSTENNIIVMVDGGFTISFL